MASKRRIRRKACTGKVRFASHAAALPTAVRLRIHAYLCPHCRGWHVGHMSRKTRVAINARRRAKEF